MTTFIKQLCKFETIIFACVTIIENIINLMANNGVKANNYGTVLVMSLYPPVKSFVVKWP